MTEQPGSAQNTAVEQLKQILKDKVSQAVGLAATAAGQQAGVLAQAIRQAGEELRQQGAENQGKVADKVAQPAQRLSATLSQFNPQSLTLDPKQIRPQLASQASKTKTQAGEAVNSQVSARTGQAGEAVSSLTQGASLTGQQMRAQGQQVPALVLDAFVEKMQPLSAYLSSADVAKVRGDLAVKGQQVKVKLSTATSAVSRTQKSASAKGAQVVKQTASGFKQSPVLPAVGALAAAVAVAARKGVKGGTTPTATPAVTPTPPVDGAVSSVGTTVTSNVSTAAELDNLSRAQLQERAVAAGLSTTPDMTKSQLRDLLLGA